MSVDRPDLNTLGEIVHDHTPDQNHAAVCTVLRWARDNRAGREAAEELCDMLGLDLAEALAGKQPESPRTGCARPDTLGEPIQVRSERLTARKVPPTRSGPPQLTPRSGQARARKL